MAKFQRPRTPPQMNISSTLCRSVRALAVTLMRQPSRLRKRGKAGRGTSQGQCEGCNVTNRSRSPSPKCQSRANIKISTLQQGPYDDSDGGGDFGRALDVRMLVPKMVMTISDFCSVSVQCRCQSHTEFVPPLEREIAQTTVRTA